MSVDSRTGSGPVSAGEPHEVRSKQRVLPPPVTGQELVLIGVLVLVCAFVARAGTRNTYVKRKLVLSVALAIGYLVSHALSAWAGTPPRTPLPATGSPPRSAPAPTASSTLTASTTSWRRRP